MANKITKDTVVNDAIKLYPATIGVFTDFGIDSCCGGAATTQVSAERDGADLADLLAALNEAAN
ncbi:MAG: DUF542 domain-containing protein [Thermodesulfobacteriota bacterium]